MKVSIVGLNHRTAPIEVRERVNFDADALPGALKDLKAMPGLAEGMILSTCNRVEVTICSADGADGSSIAEEFLGTARKVESHILTPHLYRFDDAQAIRHLFRVAASLDSMVVGEPQILGQLKSAYAAAKAEGTVTGTLENIITNAFRVAKRIRNETEIGQSAVSVSYVAVELARQIFGKLNSSTVMIVGAGKMSELAGKHLRNAGATEVLVANRTRERAQRMADQFSGRVIEYDQFLSTLPKVDIVITSSGAPFYLIRPEHIRSALEQRRNKPMFLIDIAVPRNIDPDVNKLDNVFVYDIDDLQQVVAENVKVRAAEAQSAETIIDQEVEHMLARLHARQATPTIVEIQKRLEELRAAELERMHGKLAAMSPEQAEVVELLTRSLINKIAHGPITELRRQAAAPDGVEAIEVLRRAFRLDQE